MYTTKFIKIFIIYKRQCKYKRTGGSFVGQALTLVVCNFEKFSNYLSVIHYIQNRSPVLCQRGGRVALIGYRVWSYFTYQKKSAEFKNV